jgi:hypothetical protein
VSDKTRRLPPHEEPPTVPDVSRTRSGPRPPGYTPPTHAGPAEDESLEAEVDRLIAEVVKIWWWLDELNKRLGDLEKQRNDLPRQVSDRPSETNLSLRPTRVRIGLKNWKPNSSLVWLVLGALLLLLATAVSLVWIARH